MNQTEIIYSVIGTPWITERAEGQKRNAMEVRSAAQERADRERKKMLQINIKTASDERSSSVAGAKKHEFRISVRVGSERMRKAKRDERV